MNKHNDQLDALAYSFLLMPTISANYRPKITRVNIDAEPKTYKTLIPIKKTRKNKSLKSFAIYLIKVSHRNKIKFKGRNRQINKWRFKISGLPF